MNKTNPQMEYEKAIAYILDKIKSGELSIGSKLPAERVIADTLHIDLSQVNVKATTEEGLGFTGTGEGISSQAICAIEKYTNYSSIDVAAPAAGCGGCCAMNNQ